MARVPKERQSTARESIQTEIYVALNDVNRLDLVWRPKIPRRAFERIAQLSDALAATLHQNDAVVVLVLSFAHLDSLQSELRELSNTARRALVPRKIRVAHRPRNSVKNPQFHWLVQNLYGAIVEDAGGTFAVRKTSDKGELKGTAPAVLQLLRQYLPEIIPEKLSYSTLRRILHKVANASPVPAHRVKRSKKL